MNTKTQLIILMVAFASLIVAEVIYTAQEHPILLGMSIGLSLVATGIIYLVMKRMRDKIALLSHWTQSVANGETLPECELGEESDEIDSLMRDFEQMRVALKAERSAHELKNAEILAAKQLAEEANISKSIFLANMSHEIRTPMNAILGMAELLSYTHLNETQNIYARTIQSSGNTLLRIINDILDFSKIEAGKMVIEHVPFNMREVLEDVCSVMADRAQSKNLDIYCEIESNFNLSLIGDPNRLRQVAINLLGNAIKFTDQGEVVLKMTTTARDDHKVTVQISISDTGVGIEADKLSKVFEAFSQADTSISRRFGGTGLGLSIVKQLVGLMGGEILISSHPGVGSTFTVVLPLQLVMDQQDTPIKSRIMKNVLIIDNKMKSKEILAAQLSQWSVNYSMFNSIPQVMEHYTLEKLGFDFDSILFNITDFSDDVINFCAKINETCTRIPSIIAICNLKDANEIQKYNAAMDVTVIPKPVRQSQLFNAIQNEPSLQCQISKSENSFHFNVLIAEDHEFNQKLAKAQFEALGCTVTIAVDGKEALSYYKRNDYDIIFMDCHMPNVDGYLATQLIREYELQSERGHVPIVALTANSFDSDRQKCLDCGMNDMLSKPYNRQELADKLQKWLATKSIQTIKEDTLFETQTICQDKVVINQASLEELRELNDDESPEFFDSILKDYLTATPQMIEEIFSCAKSGDLEKTRFLSHTIKSSSATVGALHFAELCRKIENSSRENNAESVMELSTLLKADYHQVDYELRKAL